MESKTKKSISLYPDTVELLREITRNYKITDDQAIKWLIESRSKKTFDRILDIIREVLK